MEFYNCIFIAPRPFHVPLQEINHQHHGHQTAYTACLQEDLDRPQSLHPYTLQSILTFSARPAAVLAADIPTQPPP